MCRLGAAAKENIIDSGNAVANLRRARDDYVDSRDICVRNWNRISVLSIVVGVGGA